jgi:acetyl-CoA carboxylase biotin carboxyl carrier protein
MSLTDDDVITIMRYLDESKFEELHLNIGDLKLIIKKPGDRSLEKHSEILSAPSAAVGENLPTHRTPPSESSGRIPVAQKAEAQVKLPTEIAGTNQIKAPIMGTFYRAPKPGAKPFVEVGQRIKEDDTVCIIEVMKLFNTVKAGVNGRIVEIMAEDAELVEFNQPLFSVDVTRE